LRGQDGALTDLPKHCCCRGR